MKFSNIFRGLLRPIHKIDEESNVTICRSCKKVIEKGFISALYCSECTKKKETR
jgi:hypothetical protein